MSFATFPSSSALLLPLYLESQPGSFTSQSGNGEGKERAQIRGSLSDFTAPFRGRARGRLHAAVRVRDNGMGCQISKLPELVGLLLPVGLLTEVAVMTTATVIDQWILKCCSCFYLFQRTHE